MDNAPYHGTSESVNSRSKKSELYKWLSENLPTEEKQNLKPEKDYLRQDLWSMAKSLKKKSNFFVIDKLAKERGHEVVR